MDGLYALLAFIIAWLIAQASKVIIGLVTDYRQNKVTDFKTLVGYVTRSGGMPSGHTASFVALTLYLGLANGFTSAIFALALACCIIVMYDAMHVRYAVGEQGKSLNKLLKKAGQPELPIVEGHTPLQVLVGGIIGVMVSLGMFWLINGGF